MNEWIRKSIELANDNDYLDQLHEVYPVSEREERQIPSRIERRIRGAYEDNDNEELVTVLLTLNKFPIDDPYVSLLRGRGNLIENNPETVERLGETLLSFDLEDLLDKCRTPIKPNTQMGPSFSNWLETLDYPILIENVFERTPGIVIFDGSDKVKMDYANRKWGWH